MAWVYGSVTGTQELAKMISEIAIGISLQSIDSIAAAGTGYTVGDEIALSGGTSTIAAVAEVLTIGGGGAVTAVRIRNAGLYQAAPSDPVSTTGGTGSGCTLNCTFDTNGWLRRRATNVTGAAQSATTGAGGTGYVVGDIISLVGGTGTVVATFRVVTAPGGVVGTVAVVDPGSYTSTPSNPASTTGGSGSGCTLNVTYGNGTSEAEIILEGPGSGGSDEIYVGMLTYNVGGVRHIENAGFTGFSEGLTWDTQPGISPGRSGTDGGSFTPTHQLSMSFWVSVSPRRIIYVNRAVSMYGSGHLGFLQPFMTTGEYPYPMYIAGSTTDNDSGITVVQEPNGSCVNPPGGLGASGAGSIRSLAGSWVRIRNTFNSTSYTSTTSGGGVWPWFSPSGAAGESTQDEWANINSNLMGSSGPFASHLPATHQYRIFPTPNTGGDLFPRFPCTVIFGSEVIYGVIEGAYAIYGAELIVPENRVKEGDRRFTVFGGGVSGSDPRGLWCIEEQ